MKSYESILQTISVFADLDGEELQQVSQICQKRSYLEGDLIFIEHTEGDELYAILAGEVSITLEMTSEEDAMPLVTLRQGDVFGELSVVDNAPRSATARALTDCQVLVIRKDEFDVLVESNHDLGFKVMRNLAKLVSLRVRNTNQKILDNVSWGMI